MNRPLTYNFITCHVSRHLTYLLQLKSCALFFQPPIVINLPEKFDMKKLQRNYVNVKRVM